MYPAVFQDDYFISNYNQLGKSQFFSIDKDDPEDVKFLYDLRFENILDLPPAHFTQGPDGYIYYAAPGDFGTATVGQSVGRLMIKGATDIFTVNDDVNVDLNTFDLDKFTIAQGTEALTGNDVVTLSDTDNIGVKFLAGGGNDTITGSLNGDDIDGGADNDTLTGGFGSDKLTGGTGADDFAYDAYDAANSQIDEVVDFSIADGDQVVFGTNGPASEEVLRNHQLNLLGTGDALFYSWYNGLEQSLDLTGVTAAQLTSASFVFDTSTTARNITGTANGDVLFGGLGDDNINGGGGDDLLIGDDGNDTLTGGAGSNRYDGGDGGDTFDGTLGTDRVDYNTVGGITLIMNGSGVATAGAGSLGEAIGDTFIGIESIRATEEADTITVDTSVDTVMGRGGNDTIVGSTDKNDIQGGEGNDNLTSGGGDDYLGGGNGNDTLTVNGTYTSATAVGGAGQDIINGGDFSDNLHGDADIDTIDGGGGIDYIFGGSGADIMDGGTGNDFFYDADGMSGDQYTGDSGYDRVTYQTGGTFDFSAFGADQMVSGIENVIFQQAVTVTGTSGVDVFTGSASVDTILGGDSNDIISGGGGGDLLLGEAGNDRLYGNGGADTIRGGLGSDIMYGGAGADTFLYMASDINTIDCIHDFQVGVDKIGLDSASFGLPAGALPASRFYNFGDTITETGPVFIYRASDNALFWDADGVGTASGLDPITYLQGVGAISESDFNIV